MSNGWSARGVTRLEDRTVIDKVADAAAIVP